MKKSKIGLTKEFPYCIKDGQLYCSTLSSHGRWERSPHDTEVKAFATYEDAEAYAQKKLTTYEIVIPYKEWEDGKT